jgi:hypothetical protein
MGPGKRFRNTVASVGCLFLGKGDHRPGITSEGLARGGGGTE